MLISYAPTGIDNFHNCKPITLRIYGDRSEIAGDFLVTKRQANRIQKHFCGHDDCRCPKGAVTQLKYDATEFGISSKYVQS